jgi:hypothetical protein
MRYKCPSLAAFSISATIVSSTTPSLKGEYTRLSAAFVSLTETDRIIKKVRYRYLIIRTIQAEPEIQLYATD